MDRYTYRKHPCDCKHAVYDEVEERIFCKTTTADAALFLIDILNKNHKEERND